MKAQKFISYNNLMKNKKILKLYRDLKKKHGHPQDQWSLWCRRPKTVREREEVIIGAILTQQANWKNVRLAMDNLKKAKINSLRRIYDLGKNNKKKLARLIRPSGFYKQKTNYLLGVAKFITVTHGGVGKFKQLPLAHARQDLLSVKGVGPETADSILNYALDKPIFVIDEYTKRAVKRLAISKNLAYNHLQGLFMENLPRNYQLYQDFHALIVIDGKNYKE